MNYIKGNFRNIIFEGNNGYKVGLFKIKETNDEEMQDFLNKVITFTGYFNDLNKEDKYIFYGSLTNHERYGYQYSVKNYEKVVPEGKDALIEFLSSSLISGCGEKTAINIVNTLGEDAINKIKENYENLLVVPNITAKRALRIYNSLIKYSATDDIMIKLKEYGFSMNEITNIISVYNEKSLDIVQENIYLLKEIIGYEKLDNIFLKFIIWLRFIPNFNIFFNDINSCLITRCSSIMHNIRTESRFTS
ncbi:MAG TPA: ATP-dependent RecD-like DNA helicase, partial [Bacilli bacterium]|nr:ATP-dependent RecD-like DNA helicase [Bacilli bacterium]